MKIIEKVTLDAMTLLPQGLSMIFTVDEYFDTEEYEAALASPEEDVFV